MGVQEDLTALKGQIEASITVIDSATVLIDGIGARIAAAVAASIANGATAEQLAPVEAVGISLKTESDALATAVAANTPAAPATPAPPATTPPETPPAG